MDLTTSVRQRVDGAPGRLIVGIVTAKDQEARALECRKRDGSTFTSYLRALYMQDERGVVKLSLWGRGLAETVGSRLNIGDLILVSHATVDRFMGVKGFKASGLHSHVVVVPNRSHAPRLIRSMLTQDAWSQEDGEGYRALLRRVEAVWQWREVEELRRAGEKERRNERAGGFDEGLRMGREDGRVEGRVRRWEWSPGDARRTEGGGKGRFEVVDEVGVVHVLELTKSVEGARALVDALTRRKDAEWGEEAEEEGDDGEEGGREGVGSDLDLPPRGGKVVNVRGLITLARVVLEGGGEGPGEEEVEVPEVDKLASVLVTRRRRETCPAVEEEEEEEEEEGPGWREGWMYRDVILGVEEPPSSLPPSSPRPAPPGPALRVRVGDAMLQSLVGNVPADKVREEAGHARRRGRLEEEVGKIDTEDVFFYTGFVRRALLSLTSSLNPPWQLTLRVESRRSERAVYSPEDIGIDFADLPSPPRQQHAREGEMHAQMRLLYLSVAPPVPGETSKEESIGGNGRGAVVKEDRGA
jgi:hypothetical protein